VEPGELVATDLQPRRGAGEPDVDREQGHERLELLAGRAVLERPAHVATEAVVDATLRDQRRDDHEAAVAKAEAVVHPGSAGGVDRLLAEAAAEALLQPAGHLVAIDAELARVRVQPALATLVAHCPTPGWTPTRGRVLTDKRPGPRDPDQD